MNIILFIAPKQNLCKNENRETKTKNSHYLIMEGGLLKKVKGVPDKFEEQKDEGDYKITEE